MPASRPRIILPPGTTLDPAVQQRLAADVDIIDASTPAGRAEAAASVAMGIPETTAASMLEGLGEGVGIIDLNGEVTWMNSELAAHTPETLRRLVDTCVDLLRSARAGVITLTEGVAERRGFRVGTRAYDVVVTALRLDSEQRPQALAAMLLDVTERRRLQERIDAIDSAGSDLLKIDSESVEKINPAERLKLLDGRVVAAVRNVFGWDHFEFRLLNRETGQLELVFCNGLAPLGIGEKIFAKAEGNGISGIVATTGESYIASDVRKDPRYMRGLPDAVSTLTVPLRLHDRVVGVFNVETERLDAFDDEDRFCAEIFGRYVALALNILDMLVVERRTTNRRVATNVLGEINGPMEQIRKAAEAIENGADARTIELAERILDAVSSVTHRIEAATSGPQTILGVEEVMREGEIDPVLRNKRILVADDEASIRDTIREVLEQKGCSVSAYASGGPAIERVLAEAATGTPFDLVISDVRMPDRNGYEVFKAVKDSDPRTPVILMTGFGYDPHHSIVRCSQEGLHCFLFKPFQVTQMLEEVRKAIDASAFAAATAKQQPGE
ncbi:MAG: response regulator [Phycisphaerae bacterium]|nr:response regulator [Phycisphaerae bacterium]